MIIINKIEITNKKGEKYDYMTSYDVKANLDMMSKCVEDVFNLTECEKSLKYLNLLDMKK